MIDRNVRGNCGRTTDLDRVPSDAAFGQTKKALILNSHQSKQPIGSDSWVENTVAAVAYAAGCNFTIVTSFGINTYELVTYLGSTLGSRMIVLIPAANGVDSQIVWTLAHEFNLSPSKVVFHPVETNSLNSKGWWPERDRVAIGLSDLILPVSLSPSGKLDRLIREFKRPEAFVDRRFAVPYRKSARRIFRPIDASGVTVGKDAPWRFVTHWTRSFNGPWPNQSLQDYYRMVAASRDTYSHSALNTLKRIVRSKQIVGTSRHIRGGYSVVSFTDHHPADAIKLMRWRARFLRWNFEPYGIAIDIDYADFMRIMRVSYGAPGLYSELPESKRPYFQNTGRKQADWTKEHEWRYHGNLSLAEAGSDKVKIIVRKKSEVTEVQRLTSFEVIALTRET